MSVDFGAFRKALFDRYSEEGDALDDDWFESLFTRCKDDCDPVPLDIYWDGETDSGNYASGDEAEIIWELSDGGFKAYWAESSTGGAQGPFGDVDGAVRALGYDPAEFPPEPPKDEDEEE